MVSLHIEENRRNPFLFVIGKYRDVIYKEAGEDERKGSSPVVIVLIYRYRANVVNSRPGAKDQRVVRHSMAIEVHKNSFSDVMSLVNKEYKGL